MSLSNHLITKVIVQTFEEKVGKWQEKKEVHKALLVSFNLKHNHDKEEGYRSLDIMIYAPMNYVGVFVRERWTVIPLEDLEDGSDGDTYVKPGKDYIEGQSEWRKVAYHDSGWRTDGVDDILREYEKRITSFSGTSFYEVIDAPKDLDI